MFDFDTEIGYTERVTERALRVFCFIDPNTLLSNLPTSGINSLALRDKMANAAEVGYFYTRKNRATCQDDTRFSENNCAMCIEYLNATIIPKYSPLVKNSIGGAA